MIDCNEWKTREMSRVHKYREIIQRLKLWWLLSVTSGPERHVRIIRPLEVSWTECICNILTLCYKMSVGHICNMVLGGLQKHLYWMSFYMFLQHKADHTDILSGLFEIHFYYFLLFHILYNFNLLMLSAVCKCQVTKFCRVAPDYGVCFMLHFLQ